MNIMVIASHPDDEVLGVGGTVINHVKMGDTVDCLIIGEGITSRYDKRAEAPKKELIVSSKNRPNITAGIIEIKMEILNSFELLSFELKRPSNISDISFLKKTIVLSAVAKCNTIVNNRLSFVEKSLSKTTLKISKCPLEEIGKNSVRP